MIPKKGNTSTPTRNRIKRRHHPAIILLKYSHHFDQHTIRVSQFPLGFLKDYSHLLRKSPSDLRKCVSFQYKFKVELTWRTHFPATTLPWWISMNVNMEKIALFKDFRTFQKLIIYGLGSETVWNLRMKHVYKFFKVKKCKGNVSPKKNTVLLLNNVLSILDWKSATDLKDVTY